MRPSHVLLSVVRLIILSTTVALVAATFAAPALADGVDSAPCVNDVRGQFAELKHHGEALGFHLDGVTPTPTLYRHYQGLQRLPGAGRPYMFLTRSGNSPGFQDPQSGNDPGNLLVVKFDSRNTSGERLRSNRLATVTSTKYTPPPVVNGRPLDRVIKNFSFEGTVQSDGKVWPAYGHPGGFQVYDDVLAIPLEAPYGGEPLTKLVLVDVAKPEQPRLLLELPLHSEQDKAGVAAITKRDGKLLLIVTGRDNQSLHVYESSVDDIRDPRLRFTRVDKWQASELVGGEWPTGTPSLQHLYLVNDCDGRLFMLATRNTAGGGSFPGNEDHAYLYALDRSTGHLRLELVRDRHLWCSEGGGVGRTCDLAAAAGFDVTPAGELILYASEHENSGPGDTVSMAEFRVSGLFRAASPNWAPEAVPGGPYSMNEGGSVTVDGSASKPALARPWAELYEDTLFRARSVVLDWDDRRADDFADLDRLDDFNDRASSLIFAAPNGCDLYLFNNTLFNRLTPTASQLVLHGNGTVQRIPDLHGPYNFGDRTSSFEFRGSACADSRSFTWEYSSSPGPRTSISPPYDGPSDRNVYFSVCGGFGVCDEAFVPVHVDNVPPTITNVAISATAPEGGSIDVSGAFTDPSPGERGFDVAVDWGDGTVDSGLAPSISGRHRYADNGAYHVRVQVCDNGGCDARVVSTTITNVAPTLTAGPDATVAEGSSFRPAVSFTDPGYTAPAAGTAETFTATIDWGDSTSSNPTLLWANGHELVPSRGGLGLLNGAHAYRDDGSYTVTVTLRDDDGGVATDTVVVTVTNVAPVAGAITVRDDSGRAVGSADVALVGLEVDVSLAFTDGGGGDTHTALIGWGDGRFTVGTVDLATRTVTGSHTYTIAAASPRFILVTITDDDGGSGQGSASVPVLDAIGATGDAIDDVRPLANDPLPPPLAHQALRSALADLEGSIGGAGTDGAVDYVGAGRPLEGIDKMRSAILHLVDADAAYPALDAVGIEIQLALTAKSLAVGAVAAAQGRLTALIYVATVAQAQTAVADGDALLVAGDRVRATENYFIAIRIALTVP